MKILFYLVCFFPFLDFLKIGLGTDVQPYALVVSIILLILYGIKNKIQINRKIVEFYLLIIGGIFAGTIITVLFYGISNEKILNHYATYISLITISFYSYLLCKQNDGIDEKLVKWTINVYLLVGIIQKYFNPTFGYEFISNARTTAKRGVVGLASEPSFYGYCCIFFLILVLNFKKERLIYVINLLFQIIFLAKSALTMVYLVILAGLIFVQYIKKLNKKRVYMILGSALLLGIICWWVLNSRENDGQRITWLLQQILSGKNILRILESDRSMWRRVEYITESLKGFLKAVGIPNGFYKVAEASGYGSLLFTLGWFGAGIIIYIFNFTKNAYTEMLKRNVIPIFISIIMFATIQVSNPPFIFLLGYFMFLSEKNNKNIDISMKQ